jgi:hypothetical protein
MRLIVIVFTSSACRQSATVIPITNFFARQPLRTGMAAQHEGTPAWLFSFVDLAFLLVIAMTQLAAEPGPDFGEIVIPRIRADSTDDLPARTLERWQLRIHPPGVDAPPPFELTLTGTSTPTGESDPARLAADELHARLQQLRSQSTMKPILAPHADARSQDLLDAVDLIEEGWPSRRRATVARVFEER